MDRLASMRSYAIIVRVSLLTRNIYNPLKYRSHRSHNRLKQLTTYLAGREGRRKVGREGRGKKEGSGRGRRREAKG